jgi:flagellar FliL protein
VIAGLIGQEDVMAEDMAFEQTPKSSKKLLVIIVVAVLLAAVGGAGWFFLASDGAAEVEAPGVSVVRKEAIYVKLRTLGGKPSFIANFSEKTGRQRYLQIYAEAMTRDQGVADAMAKHMPLVVFKLSDLFSSQSFADLQTAEGKERLRQESTRKLQELLQQEIGRPGVEQVFFTNFVMQ